MAQRSARLEDDPTRRVLASGGDGRDRGDEGSRQPSGDGLRRAGKRGRRRRLGNAHAARHVAALNG